MTQWMTLLLVFIAFIVPGKAQNIKEITAYVSGMVEFQCEYSNLEDIKQSVFSWERKNKLVVAELYHGKKKDDHVSDIYKNRSIEIKDNADLKILDIKLVDEGELCCMGRRHPLHKKCYNLKVLGNFSVPQITSYPWMDLNSVVKLPLNMELTFHCSSADGFPEAGGISWIISDDNETTVHKFTDCGPKFGSPCIIRKNSRMLNISSNFTMKLKGRTNITCVVLAHNNVTSETVQIDVKNEPPISDDNRNLIYFVLCPVLIITIVTLAICLHCRNEKMRTSRSSQNHDMNTVIFTQCPEEITSFLNDNNKHLSDHKDV